MNLISKKELLEVTGISYGQLYRWKRAKLIPEEWFIKQSAYTGQETFFPKDQIMPRVQAILDAKNRYSLEELATIILPKSLDAFVSFDKLNRIDLIDNNILAAVLTNFKKEFYDLFDVTLYVAVSQTMNNFDLSVKEGLTLLEKAVSASEKIKNVDSIYVVFKVESHMCVAFCKGNGPIEFDSDIDVIDICFMSELSNKVKISSTNLNNCGRD